MKMYLWLVLPIMFACFAVFYLYYTISRSLTFFFTQSIPIVLLSIIGALILVGLIMAFGFGYLVILLHMVVISLIIDLLYVITSHYMTHQMISSLYFSRVIIFLVTAIIISYAHYNMMHVVETNYTVNVSKSLKNEYRIGLVADLHYHTTLSEKELQEQVHQLSQKALDVLVLDGDICDEGTTYQQMQKAFELLGQVQTKYGIYFVYGNHDLQPYSTNKHYSKEQFEEELTKNHIQLLNDESIEINQDFFLIGRSDASFERTANRASAISLQSSLDTHKTLILLDHQPTGYQEIKDACYDIVLSGHTHAGQIWPAGFFASLFHFDDLNYGYELDGSLHEIVTSGIAGWGFPLRTEEHSEYVIVHLQ